MNECMRRASPFPDQSHRVFVDHFGRWPRLLMRMVLLSYFALCLVFILEWLNLSETFNLNILCPFLTTTVCALLNALLLIWAIILHLKARQIWYRNYHTGITITLALLPILLFLILFIQQPAQFTLA
ncbi:hypothetical protein VST7929_00898 [Vibrio stylophorae]|uniref:DUF805 domain-containing protein n=1 Tax=Vibrio stylophorae TaxID=659351 RepID=A0ABN8DSS4_9VIBR|nr:hypothetical protein [Vibrio stylophorae]CAH0533047.1 hypothetical protein VST7929_00898 [Vibrio stylophorae]